MAQEHHAVSPTGAALYALAVACFCFFALFEGLVGPGGVPILAGILIACFFPQLFAGLYDLNEGNSLFGNTMLYFGCFFMLGSGLVLLIEYFCGVAKLPLDPRLLGFEWSVLTVALWLWTPGFLVLAPAMLSVGLLCADVALLLIALSYFGIAVHLFHAVAGWLLFILGVIGIYYGGAFVLAEALKRPVLPIGTPLIKSASASSKSHGA